MNTQNTYANQNKQIPTSFQNPTQIHNQNQSPLQNQNPLQNQSPRQNQGSLQNQSPFHNQLDAQNPFLQGQQQFPQQNQHVPIKETEVYSEINEPGNHQEYLEKRVEFPHKTDRYELYEIETPQGTQSFYEKTEIPKQQHIPWDANNNAALTGNNVPTAALPGEHHNRLEGKIEDVKEHLPGQHKHEPGHHHKDNNPEHKHKHEQGHHHKTHLPGDKGHDHEHKSHHHHEHKAHLPGEKGYDHEHKTHLPGEKGYEPRLGEPGYVARVGEPGYDQKAYPGDKGGLEHKGHLPGELGYEPRLGEPGYDARVGEHNRQPAFLPGEPGYENRHQPAYLPGEPGYEKNLAPGPGDYRIPENVAIVDGDKHRMQNGGNTEIKVKDKLPGDHHEHKSHLPGEKGYDHEHRAHGDKGKTEIKETIIEKDRLPGDKGYDHEHRSHGDKGKTEIEIKETIIEKDRLPGDKGYDHEHRSHGDKGKTEIKETIIEKDRLPGEKGYDHEHKSHLPGEKGYDHEHKNRLPGEKGYDHEHKNRLHGEKEALLAEEIHDHERGNAVPVLPPGPGDYRIPENVANVTGEKIRMEKGGENDLTNVEKRERLPVETTVESKIETKTIDSVPTEHNLNERRPHTPGEHHISKSNRSPRNTVVNGDQTDSRKRSAQEALKHLQIVVGQGSVFPGTDTLTSALRRAEEVLQKEVQANDVDAETKKTLEDLALLVGSAKQLIKHKDIGDRVQRITEETKMAIDEVNLPGLSGPAREATQQAIDFTQNWRPLIQLLTSSREFRVLIIDSIQILRRVFLRHGEGMGDSIQTRFIEGENPLDIARTTTQQTASTFSTSEGEPRIDITEEEYTGLQDDITRVMATVAQHPSYHKVIESLFDMIEVMRVQLRQAPANVTPAQPHARRARIETEELIADFSGREALNDFMDSYTALSIRIDQNEKPRRYLRELREFILSTKSSEYIQSQEFRNRSRELTNEAQRIANEYVYTQELSDFLDCAEQLLYNIKNDEFMQILRHHAGLVADDLSYVDSDGKTQLDTDMLGKLQGVLIPILADSLKYIPIPRMESSDAKQEYWVDNIVLCGYDIIPDKIRVQLESDNDINIRHVETKRSHTRLIITLSQIRVEVKDIDFYFKRKSFPEMSDAGRVTVRLGGPRGATLTLNFRVSQTTTDPVPRFRKGTASFDIQNLQIEFDKRTIHHNVLLPIISKVFKNQIKRQVESGVERSLNKLVNTLGERMTESMLQVNRPFMARVDQVRDVLKATEFAQTFEKRQQKLE